MIDRSYAVQLSQRSTDIKEHILTLYDLVVRIEAKVVVELGAGQSTYALLAAVNQTGGQLYSIDLLPKAHLRGFPEGEGILEKEDRYNFVQGNDMEIIQKWDSPIDFLFIDTSHVYKHTLSELLFWTPFVRLNGIVTMHDTDHNFGHAVKCKKALEDFLKQNPGQFSVQHILGCGGLSILNRIKDL